MSDTRPCHVRGAAAIGLRRRGHCIARDARRRGKVIHNRRRLRAGRGPLARRSLNNFGNGNSDTPRSSRWVSLSCQASRRDASTSNSSAHFSFYSRARVSLSFGALSVKNGASARLPAAPSAHDLYPPVHQNPRCCVFITYNPAPDSPPRPCARTQIPVPWAKGPQESAGVE